VFFSPRALGSLPGDFVLLARHDDGLLVASGLGGGYRPIFVSSPSADDVVACSHLAPLLSLSRKSSRLDVDHLATSLLPHQTAAANSTPYQNIACVPPGEAWILRPGRLPVRWSLLRGVEEELLPDDAALASRLRQEIELATIRCLMGNAGTGVLTSGGLDSSFLLSILALRSDEGRGPKPCALALEFPAPRWHDDRPFVQSLEEHLKVRAHKVTPRNAAPFVGKGLVVDAMPAPSPFLIAVPELAARAQLNKVDTVLTGEGGDWLDGDPRFFGELARRGKLLTAVHGSLWTRGVFYDGPIGRLYSFLLRPLIPTTIVSYARRLRYRRPAWAGPTLERHARHLGPAAIDQPSLHDPPQRRYRRLLDTIAESSWPLMRHHHEIVAGYNLRAPFLDSEFLRFVATIPPMALLRNGFLRGLMREAMHGLVPECLRLRESKGSWYWFIRQAVEMAGGLLALEHLADVRMLADLGLVEPRRFRPFFDSFALPPRGDTNYLYLWKILSIEAFLRQWDSGLGEPPS
jgi:asparagine synthetase B (glutamine-hydrolysing)